MHSFIHSSAIILLSHYLMNGLTNRDETYSEHSLALIDDLVRFWRSKVKSQQAIKLMRYPCQYWCIEVF